MVEARSSRRSWKLVERGFLCFARETTRAESLGREKIGPKQPRTLVISKSEQLQSFANFRMPHPALLTLAPLLGKRSSSPSPSS